MRKHDVTLATVVYAAYLGYRTNDARPVVVLDTGNWRNTNNFNDEPDMPRRYGRDWRGLGAKTWLILVDGDNNPETLLSVAAGLTIPDADDEAQQDTNVSLPADTPEGVRLATVQAKNVARPWSEQPAYEAAERAKHAEQYAARRAEQKARDELHARLTALIAQTGVDLGTRPWVWGESISIQHGKLITILERLAKAEAYIDEIGGLADDDPDDDGDDGFDGEVLYETVDGTQARQVP